MPLLVIALGVYRACVCMVVAVFDELLSRGKNNTYFSEAQYSVEIMVAILLSAKYPVEVEHLSIAPSLQLFRRNYSLWEPER